LVIIPLVLLVIAVVLLVLTMVSTGMPVTPGIDFSGGTAVTIVTADTKEQLQSTFAGYPLVDISEGVNNGYFLKFGAMDDAKFRSLSALISEKFPDAKVDQIGETFGKTLQSQAVNLRENPSIAGCACSDIFFHWYGYRDFFSLPDIRASGGSSAFSIC